jgi:hypothetical protein
MKKEFGICATHGLLSITKSTNYFRSYIFVSIIVLSSQKYNYRNLFKLFGKEKNQLKYHKKFDQ